MLGQCHCGSHKKVKVMAQGQSTLASRNPTSYRNCHNYTVWKQQCTSHHLTPDATHWYEHSFGNVLLHLLVEGGVVQLNPLKLLTLNQKKTPNMTSMAVIEQDVKAPDDSANLAHNLEASFYQYQSLMVQEAHQKWWTPLHHETVAVGLFHWEGLSAVMLYLRAGKGEVWVLFHEANGGGPAAGTLTYGFCIRPQPGYKTRKGSFSGSPLHQTKSCISMCSSF